MRGYQRAIADGYRAAAAAALGEAKFAPNGEITLSRNNFTTPVKQRFDSIGNSDRIDVMRKGARAIKATSPEVTQALVRYLDQVQRVTIVNTDGQFITDESSAHAHLSAGNCDERH
ncbi:MAG: hypothetical protein R2912_04130 [Eubacteriales bacterium]